MFALQKVVFELDDAALQFGDPLAVWLGRERGAGDGGQLGSDLAAEVLAEPSFQQLDHGLLASQLRGVVGGLDPQMRGGLVALRDRLSRMLLVGGGELLLDLLLEIAVLGVVDELHAHARPARERRPVEGNPLVDHHLGGVQHRGALLLGDEPVMLSEMVSGHERAGSKVGSIAITLSWNAAGARSPSSRAAVHGRSPVRLCAGVPTHWSSAAAKQPRMEEPAMTEGGSRAGLVLTCVGEGRRVRRPQGSRSRVGGARGSRL